MGGGAASWGGTGGVASVRTATWRGGGMPLRDVLVLARGTGKWEGDDGKGPDAIDEERGGMVTMGGELLYPLNELWVWPSFSQTH